MTPWLRFPSPCYHNPVIASISTIDTSAYHPRSWLYASANPSPNPFLTDVDLLLVEFQNQNMKLLRGHPVPVLEELKLPMQKQRRQQIKHLHCYHSCMLQVVNVILMPNQ
uniref:Uncharacterized protein n=1 Tax=Vitis vinifera TaxID=29760 RepID=F6GYF6_VITVI